MSFFLGDIFKDKKIDEKFVKPKLQTDDFYETKIVPKRYIGIIPGTEQWMEVWKAHPDLQEEMLEYQNKCFMWCNRREQRVSTVICRFAKEKQKEECMGCEKWPNIL